MKKIINTTHLEGYLYSHDLQLRKTGDSSKNPGTEYISGTLEILTDDAGLNVVPVNFRYVTETTKAGKKNATFGVLKGIIESTGKTYQEAGAGAMKLKVDTALGLNDFYNADNELITYKLNDGGFVHPVTSFGENRNSFEVDMLITNVVRKEEDSDKGTPEILFVKGATFNFMKSLLPIELVVKDPKGMDYFEGLGASSAEPVFLKVWGHVACSTISTESVEESAFGEPAVKTSTRRLREWVVTGASTEPYGFGEEAVLTGDEVKEAMAAREVYLADVKKRHDEYVASKSESATSGPAAAPGGYVF